MKKLLALILALLVALSLFVGCSNSSSDSDDSEKKNNDSSQSEDKSSEDDEKQVELVDAKIGVCLYNLEDAINIRRKATWEYFADHYDNVEVTFQAAANEAEEVIAAVENFLLQGCNGIIVSSVEGIDQVMDLCDEAGAYLMLITTSCNTQEMFDSLNESDYWLGTCNYSPEAEATLMAEQIIEDGHREIIFIGAPEGLITFETAMSQAYFDYFDEWNKEHPDDQVTLHVNRVQHANMAETCAAQLAAWPNATAVIGTESGLKFCYPQIANANLLGKVQLYTWTVYETATDAFANGTLQYILPKPDDQAYVFYIMYNAIQGVPVGEARDYISATVRIKSAEDLAVYFEKYSDDTYQVITYDYAKKFDKTVNPDVTADDIQADMDLFTMENVTAGKFGG